MQNTTYLFQYFTYTHTIKYNQSKTPFSERATQTIPHLIQRQEINNASARNLRDCMHKGMHARARTAIIQLKRHFRERLSLTQAHARARFLKNRVARKNRSSPRRLYIERKKALVKHFARKSPRAGRLLKNTKVRARARRLPTCALFVSRWKSARGRPELHSWYMGVQTRWLTRYVSDLQ